MHDLPSELKAKLEFSKYKELFKLAEDHKLIYLTLQDKAASELRPIVDFYIQDKRFEDAIDFVNDNYPDSVIKTLTMKMILDKQACS